MAPARPFAYPIEILCPYPTRYILQHRPNTNGQVFARTTTGVRGRSSHTTASSSSHSPARAGTLRPHDAYVSESHWSLWELGEEARTFPFGTVHALSELRNRCVPASRAAACRRLQGREVLRLVDHFW